MATETHPVFMHNKCPKGCGITKAIIMNNECLYCQCDWFSEIIGEDEDEDELYLTPAPADKEE